MKFLLISSQKGEHAKLLEHHLGSIYLNLVSIGISNIHDVVELENPETSAEAHFEENSSQFEKRFDDDNLSNDVMDRGIQFKRYIIILNKGESKST